MGELKKNIAENIISLRTSRNMTQIDLAEKLNYSNKAVSKWERGEATPDVEVLNSIALLFGVDIEYLITPAEENAKKQRDRKSGLGIPHKKLLITLFVITIVWVIAGIIYAYYGIKYDEVGWTVFMWCIPTSALILTVFASVWGKGKFNLLLSSVFIWSILLCFFFQFFEYKIYLVFTIGIPAQFAAVLWSNIKK